MEQKTGTLWEWIIPFALVTCAGWAIWHTPAYLLDLIPPSNQSLLTQLTEQHARKDAAPNMPRPFGGQADILDWLALIMVPILFVIGVRGVGVAKMEYEDWNRIDRIAMFIGRITMILIISMTVVMLYEVFLRYAIEAPTLWANELTLWMAGFVFLLSGIYAMQQRCHIRIFLLYDVVPRWMQHLFDVISTFLLCVFAFFLVFGSYKQVFAIKFYKWETFGTAFDPPIPSTIQPMVLIVVVLVAVQSVLNLINDWNKEPSLHTGPDDLDEDELEAIKRSVGAE